MAKTSRASAQFQLRLPEELREAIRAAADASGRSMNAEIVYRLEESVVLNASPHPNASFLEVPEGITEEDLSSAIAAANQQAVALALERLGIKRKMLEPEPSDSEL